MHIIIGLLTALAGLVWARRRKWERTYGMKSLYNIPDYLRCTFYSAQVCPI